MVKKFDMCKNKRVELEIEGGKNKREMQWLKQEVNICMNIVKGSKDKYKILQHYYYLDI